MAQLTLKDVTKRFGEVTAVNRLNLEVNKGECFSFLGPSGCGKTTTLRMIAGFEDLDEGELSVDGTVSPPATRSTTSRPRTGLRMVFQAFAVWPHLNVYRNVSFPLEIRKLPKHEIHERWRARSSTPPLPAGARLPEAALRRRTAAHRPGPGHRDQPQDHAPGRAPVQPGPQAAGEMRFEIKDLQKKFDLTIIFVTHDQAEAMALSDRMLVMRDGVVQQVDTHWGSTTAHQRVLFSFIGLSNFIPVERTVAGVRIAGARRPGRSPDAGPGRSAAQAGLPAERDRAAAADAAAGVRPRWSGERTWGTSWTAW
jgi:iron(III) transport system ATP-binding protein